MAEIITLRCCCCGESKTGEIERLPIFAFELAAIANAAGMKGVIDGGFGRCLVFCGDDCAKASLTKKGYFPARIKRVPRPAHMLPAIEAPREGE